MRGVELPEHQHPAEICERCVMERTLAALNQQAKKLGLTRKQKLVYVLTALGLENKIEKRKGESNGED